MVVDVVQVDRRERRGTASFRVPIAKDGGGNEVQPTDAVVRPFVCLDCGTAVSLRRAHERDGYAVRAHFAHKPRVGCAFSEGEGERHLRAKRRIAELVEQRAEIVFVRHCPKCDFEHRQRLPESVHRASLEHHLVSGRRADVALLDEEDEVLAVVEVLETHAVDQDKRIDLAHLRWFEVSAESVLGGETWLVLQDHLLPFTCPRCRATATRPFVGACRLDIECPLAGAGAVRATTTCAGCSYFLGASASGITCWGSAS